MQDLLLDSNYDLQINSLTGDFAVGDSTQQEIQLLLYAEKGDWKFSPVSGVSARRYLKSSGQLLELEAAIRLQMQLDNLNVQQLSITTDASGLPVLSIAASR
jgi:hypothetical protein